MRRFSLFGSIGIFVLGVLLAPLLLPLATSFGGGVAAQSLPWTPTPETPSSVSLPSSTSTPIATGAPSVTPSGPTPTATELPPAIQVTALTATTKEPTAPADATATSSASGATSSPTVAATARPGTLPDRCEPNDTLVQPCAVSTEIDILDLTFVDDALDVYAAILKAGRTYTIKAASSTGIDPALTLYLAGDTATVLAQNDDIGPGSTDAAVQVTTTQDAWYLIAVANNAPGAQIERTYTLSIRSAAPIAATSGPNTTATAEVNVPIAATGGDAYENNFSPETAGVLAWGVPYDLSLICPQPHACASGDHDFFWLPVKRGVPLVAVTYDLGPGADTSLALYRPATGFTDPSTGLVGWQVATGNDDVVGGFTLRSQILVTPDWDGYALLVIAASARADPPPLPPAVGQAGRYRLMVGPPAFEAVQQVLDAQTDIPPAPTSAPTQVVPTGAPLQAPVVPTAAVDVREVIKEESGSGLAVVIAATTLYAAAPPTETDALATYAADAEVRLLGQSYAGWVKVQPVDSVTPGWMWGPNLRPVAPTTADTSASASAVAGGLDPRLTPLAGTSGPTGSGPTPTPTPTPTSGAQAALVVVAAAPLATPTPVTVRPDARTVTIEVCAVTTPSDARCQRPLANLRVELVRVADAVVIFTGRTDRDGRVTPSVRLAPGTAIDVQIGALGLRGRLPASGNLISIRVVEALGGAL